MDLGHLLDNSSYYDKWQFPANLCQNSLLQTKTIDTLG